MRNNLPVAVPVAATELRRRLRDHLDGVLAGQRFEVARNGQVVAVLGPPDEATDVDGVAR